MNWDQDRMTKAEAVRRYVTKELARLREEVAAHGRFDAALEKILRERDVEIARLERQIIELQNEVVRLRRS